MFNTAQKRASPPYSRAVPRASTSDVSATSPAMMRPGILSSILVVGLMAFAVAFAPVAVAINGGGRGAGVGSAPGGAGPGTAGLGRGGFSGPSMGNMPSRPMSPSMPRMPSNPGYGAGGRFGGSMPSNPGYGAGGRFGGSMPSNPGYGAGGRFGGSMPTNPGYGAGGRFGGPMGGRSGFAAPGRAPAPPRATPNMNAPTFRGPSPSVNTPAGGGQFRGMPGMQGSSVNRSGAGRNPALPSIPSSSSPARTPGQFRSRNFASPSGTVATPSLPAQPGRGPAIPAPATGRGVQGRPGPSGSPNAVTQPGRVPTAPGRVPGPATGRGVQGRRGPSGSPNAITQPGGVPTAPGQVPGPATGRGVQGRRGPSGSPNAITQPGRVPTAPGQTPGPTTRRGPRGGGAPSGGPGAIGQPGRGGGRGGQGFDPGQARQQWNQSWDKHRGHWNHNGNWNHNNHWNWNNSSFSIGLFFYPGFASGFDYGYWGFGGCGAYCTYSPFYYYGMPYVYAPRVVVADVPSYTYTPAPDYSYGTGYYLSQGSYSGLDAAFDDIRNGWINGRADLILRHVDAGTQVAIYLDGNYAYSVSGSDYRAMVTDAAKNVRTVSFVINDVDQRSDGAYTASGTHEFDDVNNNHKVVNVTYTLAQQGGKWVIVAAGSSETA